MPHLGLIKTHKLQLPSSHQVLQFRKVPKGWEVGCNLRSKVFHWVFRRLQCKCRRKTMKLRHLHASLLRLQEQAQLLEEERCIRVDPMQVPCGQPFKMEA